MTNKKEIIIDDVDVSECDYAILPKKQCPAKSMPYAKETSCIACKEHNTKHNFCKNNPNCNFKRLKRKERELEPFKDDYFKNLDTKTIAELAKKSIRLTTENRKFEDALDEIEENIKAMNNECFYDDICECNNCDMKNGCTYYRKFNILNIINKAKGGVNGNT